MTFPVSTVPTFQAFGQAFIPVSTLLGCNGYSTLVIFERMSSDSAWKKYWSRG